ncbi:MAG: dolichyl-phosphate beta-glucosyltransferase [Candidatus Liptonbacteria bacterium]
MVSQPFLSIIIPAHNESKRLPITLLDIDKRMTGVDYNYEILVVENGSKDNTAEIVRKMMPTIKGLRLMELQIGNKGNAVRQGMLVAQGKYRLFMDADNATTIDHFERMRPFFSSEGGHSSGEEDHYDVVICSRSHKESKLDPPQPIYRQIPGKIGNLIIQILVLPGIWDTQCGFKAFSASAAEKIFKLSRIAGWGFDVEILALAQKFGFKIKEVPVHWVNDINSTVGMSAYLTTLWDTLRIRWWLWTGVYKEKKEAQVL